MDLFSQIRKKYIYFELKIRFGEKTARKCIFIRVVTI